MYHSNQAQNFGGRYENFGQRANHYNDEGFAVKPYGCPLNYEWGRTGKYHTVSRVISRNTFNNLKNKLKVARDWTIKKLLNNL